MKKTDLAQKILADVGSLTNTPVNDFNKKVLSNLANETGIISKGSHTRVAVESKKFQHKADDKLNAAVNRHLEQYS